MKKTVLEWLNQAKADGKEWADAAIKNTKAANGGHIIVLNIKAAIMHGFQWDEVDEDFGYWEDVYNSL